MNNQPYDPNNPYSQPTTPGHYPPFNQQPWQPSYSQWGQQAPPPPQFPTNPGQHSQSGQNFPQYLPPYPQPGQFVPPAQQQSQKPPKPPLFDLKARREYFKKYPPSKKQQLATGCGTLIGILLLCSMCSAIANAGNSQQQPTAAQIPSSSATQARPTQNPTETPTPSLTPTETPTPKPVPTQPPVQQSVQQQQPAQQPTPATGVNGNPWGYDFNPGNYISNPPSTFCSYFNCIPSFWNGTGYVIECNDATYSKSGGRSGSCSHHGGDWRALYSH